MTLVIAWRTTKLIEGGHRGLQAYRPICYYFYVFTFFTFFPKSKKRDFLRFLPCFIRFLELCLQLRFDYDPTTTYGARLLLVDAIRREQKMNMSIFRRSRITVESLSS